MNPAWMALGAALSFSMSQVFVRLGSRTIAPLAGVVLSLGASMVVLTTALLIRGVVRPSWTALGVFMLAGMIGPSIGRIMSITSTTKLGATRAAPVKSAAQPIVAVLLGVIVLSETIAWTRVAGIALTLTGVLLVVRSSQRRTSQTLSAAQAEHDSPIPNIAGNLRILLWPIGAGTAYAVGDMVRKTGMQIMDDVLLGSSVGVIVGFSIWFSVLLARGEAPALLRGMRTRATKWFLASGCAAGAAQVFVFTALRDGDLSMVGPIISVQPIIVAIVARVFINRLEDVGLAVGIAAVLAAAGTILVSL